MMTMMCYLLQSLARLLQLLGSWFTDFLVICTPTRLMSNVHVNLAEIVQSAMFSLLLTASLLSQDLLCEA